MPSSRGGAISPPRFSLSASAGKGAMPKSMQIASSTDTHLFSFIPFGPPCNRVLRFVSAFAGLMPDRGRDVTLKLITLYTMKHSLSMFFCLLFPKKRALFENKTPISRQKRAQDLNDKEGSAGSKSHPAVFMPPTPSKASQTGRRGARGRAPTAISDNKQRRSWVQTVTKQAPGAEASCARRRICFRLGRSMAPASRSLIGAIHESPVFVEYTTVSVKGTGVFLYL